MEEANAERKGASSKRSTPSLPKVKVFPIRSTRSPFRAKVAPELIVDQQLHLRSLRAEDAEPFFSLVEANRDYLQIWLPWIETVKSLSDARTFIRKARYTDIFSGRWVYAIHFEGKMVGMMDFNEGDKALKQVSLGYWLGAAYQGKGIITRSVRRCVEYAFEQQGLNKVLIKCATENLRSQAIPIRLNFTWEGIEYEAGTLQGEVVNLVVYGMNGRDWKDAQTPSDSPAE